MKATEERLRISRSLYDDARRVYDRTGSISRDELMRLEAEYAASQGRLDQLKAQKEREKLEHQGAVQERQMRQLVAPVAGVVTKVDIEVGEWAKPGEPLIRLVDASTLVFKANLPMAAVAGLQVADAVAVLVEDGAGGRRGRARSPSSRRSPMPPAGWWKCAPRSPIRAAACGRAARPCCAWATRNRRRPRSTGAGREAPPGWPAPPAPRGRHDVRSLLMGLHELRQSQVDAAFWASFCTLIAALCRARAAVVVRARRHRRVAELGSGRRRPGLAGAVWPQLVGDVDDRAAANGFAYVPSTDVRGEPRLFAAVRMLGVGEALRAAGHRLAGARHAQRTADARDAGGRRRRQSARRRPRHRAGGQRRRADAPRRRRPAADAGPGGPGDAGRSFELASLKLVNGLAAHYGLVQCALGWEHGAGQRAVAVSHLENASSATPRTSG
jgi:hypothetical protein